MMEVNSLRRMIDRDAGLTMYIFLSWEEALSARDSLATITLKYVNIGIYPYYPASIFPLFSVCQ
jgi:hypothetical protein